MTNEQRNAIINDRILQFEIELLQLEIDLVALGLSQDEEMMKQVQERIALVKATITEVEKMKVI